ncbi:MAG: 3-oxoacyl-ACP reductase, partial [Micrococcaceae bacterium]|nr:3-oxoacyl-ACP reductase [Micrococcaceae bacterium]
MNLSDQLVLVTGGARGLGRHIVTAFAGQGARVIINYRQSAQAAQELASTLGPDRALAVQADVTDPAQVATMLETAQAHFGSPVTTVVNNALADFSFNGEARSSAADIGWEEFTTQFSGSVRGALNTSQAALPGMREHGFGRIINIGTNLFQNPVVPYHDYTASKAALLALTRTLAADLGQHEVSVNMVSGGLLRTTDAS